MSLTAGHRCGLAQRAALRHLAGHGQPWAVTAALPPPQALSRDQKLNSATRLCKGNRTNVAAPHSCGSANGNRNTPGIPVKIRACTTNTQTQPAWAKQHCKIDGFPQLNWASPVVMNREQPVPVPGWPFPVHIRLTDHTQPPHSHHNTTTASACPRLLLCSCRSSCRSWLTVPQRGRGQPQRPPQQEQPPQQEAQGRGQGQGQLPGP